MENKERDIVVIAGKQFHKSDPVGRKHIEQDLADFWQDRMKRIIDENNRLREEIKKRG